MSAIKATLIRELSTTLRKQTDDIDCDLPLEELGVEDAGFENIHKIMDRHFKFENKKSLLSKQNTINDIVNYYSNNLPQAKDISNIRKYIQQINMPQMALTGLSESWLFKEIGDCHWHMLCQDLGMKSSEIHDEFGNRLYATFIRIKYESSNSLKDYQENDNLEIEGSIQRFGNSLYCGNINISSDGKFIKCSLATTFSTRDSSCNNHSLTKGVPSGSDANTITKITDIPSLVLDHMKLKKRSVTNVLVGNYSFDTTEEVIYQTSYTINPYTDINGVGLLYFAAYPLINDYCELDFFNKKRIAGKHWALNSATMIRDIYYFANCNIDDIISYQLHSYDIFSENNVAIQSSLCREKDNTVIAKIFTVKQFNM